MVTRPADIAEAVKELHEAPKEVADAVSAIRKAMKEIECPCEIKNHSGKGYVLLVPKNP